MRVRPLPVADARQELLDLPETALAGLRLARQAPVGALGQLAVLADRPLLSALASRMRRDF